MDHDVVVNRDSTATVETAKVSDLHYFVSANFFLLNNVIMTHNYFRGEGRDRVCPSDNRLDNYKNF